MKRKIILKCICSGTITGFIGMLILLIQSLRLEPDGMVFMPEFRNHFPSDIVTVCVYFFLLCCIGAVFGAASGIFDIEKWSFLKQGIVHFLLTAIVAIPISAYIWVIYIYPTALISVICGYLLTYATTWISNAIMYKRSVQEINNTLEQLLLLCLLPQLLFL